MALTLSYIGPVGMQAPTESKFWFTSIQRKCSQLSKSFTVPMGDYLVAWRGTLNEGTLSGVIFTNDVRLDVNQRKESAVGGMVRLFGVTNITLSGTGDASFKEDPEVIFVRFG